MIVRHVTILFCDLVRSTELARRLDIEDQRIVYRAFHEIVSRVTDTHGGHLHRFVGDGALASFGYPVAREDAEESALRAGLEMVRALRAARPIPDLELRLRVGIASGTVGIGEVVRLAAAQEQSVAGWVVHLAARLQSEAPADGGVVVADATRRLAGSFFEYRDLGLLSLRGFDREQAWLVLGETAIASRFEAQRFGRSTATLVGRDDVMLRLTSEWQRARAGSGGMVLLTGDPGIGKSRLARALYDLSAKDGATRFELDCADRTSHTPLHPIGALLSRIVGVRHAEAADSRRRRLKRLLGRVLGTARVEFTLRYLAPLIDAASAANLTESAERIRENTISALIDVVKAIAARTPALLLLEDMHWADATTVLFVRQIADELRSMPVLILATMRVSPDGPAIEIPGATVLPIGALESEASAQIVRNTTGGESLTGNIVEVIVRRAEGNPLFLEELTRAEIDSPLAHTDREHQSAGAEWDVPLWLQRAIAARLDRWPSLRPFVQAAAVLGRDFPMRLLRALLPDRSAELPDAVARLIDLELLTVSDTGTRELLRFKHALIHESVYQTLLRSERQQLHSRTAELLVQHFDGLPESAPGVLAHHLGGAQRFDEAVQCLVAASAETARRGAYRESTEHSRAALAWVEKLTNERTRLSNRLQLLTQLGEALSATQGYSDDEVRQTYNAARALCHEEVDHVASFPILRGLTTFYFVRNEQQTADELSTRCLNLAKATGRLDFIIEALTVRGYTSMYLGRLLEAQETLDACVSLYGAHHQESFKYASPQDPGNAAWSLLGTIAWLRGDSEAAESHLKRALAHVEHLQRPFDRAYACCFLAQQCNLQRHFGLAVELADEAVQISQRHGFGIWLVCGIMQSAIGTASSSQSETAVATLEQALAAYMHKGARAAVPFFKWGLAAGLAKTGVVDKARELVDEGLLTADETGEVYLKSELLILKSDLETDPNAAVPLLWEAASIAERQRSLTQELRAVMTLTKRLEIPSTDPERDRAAWDALNGVGDYPDDGNWVGLALARAKSVLPAQIALGS